MTYSERKTKDMKVRLKKLFFIFIATSLIFILWKLKNVEKCNEAVDIRKSVYLLKDVLHLSPAQLTLLDNLVLGQEIEEKPCVIYAITPTYSRYVQKAELTRISQTLSLVPNVHWIIVEDAVGKSELVRTFLHESNLAFTHLFAKTLPPTQKETKNKERRHRGVDQRNEAMKWLRENLNPETHRGVVFFMDDDNTYSVKLFEEIAKVKKVGVWPVGLVGGYNVETPVVDSKTGKVTAFKSGWIAKRPFPIDMAGFAINLELILKNTNAQFSHKMTKGHQESEFLKLFTTREDLEPLADNCTKVYVWHTRTELPKVRGNIPGFEV